jgi:hypothetical protein
MPENYLEGILAWPSKILSENVLQNYYYELNLKYL